MPERWCAVTVTDPRGQRHSVDVFASSTFDAAHLYLTHVKNRNDTGLPMPDQNTVFDVVIGGKIYTVKGAALKKWIQERRETFRGPKGLLFKQRPIIE
jgi:hypothetical protein